MDNDLSHLHHIHFTAKEVCRLLGFSERTFFNRAKAGKIMVTRSATEHTRDGRPRIFVCADDLAAHLGFTKGTDEPAVRALLELPAMEVPTPERPVDHKIFAHVEAPPRMPDIEPDAFRPQQSGPEEFRDSFGHTLTGNAEHRLFATRSGPPQDLQGHMQAGLLGTSGPTERHSFDRGLSDDDLAKMKSDWRRRGGGLSMSEQRERQERSKALIRAAFPKAQRT